MKLFNHMYYLVLAGMLLSMPGLEADAYKVKAKACEDLCSEPASKSKKSALQNEQVNGCLPFNKKPDYCAKADMSEPVRLVSSLPWEVVRDNVKTWKFLLLNYDPVTFNSQRLEKIACIVEDYIATYFYPTYRVKVQIDMITPPTDAQFVANDLPSNASRVPVEVDQTAHIPIYLVDEFSSDLPNGFGTAFHGQVNDSVMNGIHPLFYLNPSSDFTQKFGILAAGMPFIIIPRGSVGPNGTDNGIVAEVAENMILGYGPTEFYDALAYTLAFQIIEVLDNPASLIYILNGNTLQELGAGAHPKETAYLKSLCAPFSTGADNIRCFKGYSMPNFAFPSYFHPYIDQVSHGTAVYDSMGNGSAPLTPYKGVQFVMYQEALHVDPDPSKTVVTDLQAGVYVSSVDSPFNLTFTSFGSIYSWEGWGFQLAQNNEQINEINVAVPELKGLDAAIARGKKSILHNANFSEAVANKATKKIALKAIAHRLVPGRKHTGSTVARVAQKGTTVKTAANTRAKNKCFDPKQPHLLPFQYINEEGWLTQRYAVINYSKKVDLNTLIIGTQSVVDNARKLFLPHWNIMVDAAIYDISLAKTREEALAKLPAFDGTFIPFFITIPEQYRTDTSAVFFLGGGISDVNNVPDVLAGPTIDFYFKETPLFPIPDLPIGNPMIIESDLNFHGTVTVTTDDPSVPGPYTMGIASFEPSNVTFPIVAPGVINPFPIGNPDLTMCQTPPDNTPFQGKILVFTNNPPCQTAGPQRYTNVNNSGAIASIAVPRFSSTFGFPSNLGLPYVSEPSQYMVGTSTPIGNAIVAAIQKANSETPRRDVIITIDNPVFPVYASVQGYTEGLSHEFYELAKDPNYATYVATSNPPLDQTIVFHQMEAADPMEAVPGPRTMNKEGKIFEQTSFPTPAYFVPNLKFKVYDDQSLNPKPLIPFSRQQTAVHQAPIDGVAQPISPMQFLSIETSVPGAVYSQSSFSGFNIFNPRNYFVPFSDEVLFAPDIEFHDMPWFSVYHKLLTNDHVAAYDNIALIGPNSDWEF